MINMWKLDSTRFKHVIKTNQNKQNSKNPKGLFGWRSEKVEGCKISERTENV